MLMVIRWILLFIALFLTVLAREDVARTISIIFCTWTLISGYTFYNAGVSARKANTRENRRFQLRSRNYIKHKAIGSSITLSLIMMAVIMRSILD